MKNSTVDLLLQKNNVIPFDFGNDDYKVSWYVTPAETKLIGKRVVETKNGEVYEVYVKVPYAKMDHCVSVYDRILQDFIDCYGEDLYCGNGCADYYSLFSKVASPDNSGLEWMLSIFGKLYHEFLVDLFYWYGQFVEEWPFLEDEGALIDQEEVAFDEKMASVCAVLEQHTDALLTLYYSDDSVIHWEFAIENGRLWYLKQVMSYVVDDILEYKEDCGSFSIDDPDAWGALRDFVLTEYWDERLEQDTQLGDPLGLIGINSDDLEDDDDDD